MRAHSPLTLYFTIDSSTCIIVCLSRIYIKFAASILLWSLAANLLVPLLPWLNLIGRRLIKQDNGPIGGCCRKGSRFFALEQRHAHASLCLPPTTAPLGLPACAVCLRWSGVPQGVSSSGFGLMLHPKPGPLQEHFFPPSERQL